MNDREAVIEKIIESLSAGAPEYTAAKLAGIEFMTLWRWKKEIPGLAERIHEAKLVRVPLLEERLYKGAMSEKLHVTAILALLEKYDKGWRDRAKDIAPSQNVLVLNGEVGHMIGKMDSSKKQKFIGALHMAGLLPDHVIDVIPSENGHSNGNGSNGATNGNGAH